MIAINDILDNFRDEIYQLFSPYYNAAEDMNYGEVESIINKIKKNERIYNLFLTILFLDDYKIKYHYYTLCDIEDDELDKLNFYQEKINNISDVVEYFDNTGVIMEVIPSTLIFNKINSNEKREVMVENKSQNKYLNKISGLHTLDLLYYATPYNLDYLINTYYEYEEEEMLDARSEAKIEFSSILKDLYISDKDNYLEIVKKLREAYKILSFHKIFDDEELNKIINYDIIDLCNLIYNDSHIRLKLLDYYLEYNILCSKEEQEVFKEEYKKVYKKENWEE